MHVLVTGGRGYIGHAVTFDLLAHGHEVTILTRGPGEVGAPPTQRARIVTGDLLDAARISDVVRSGGFDAVVHLGGLARARESFEQPLAYFEANVGGTMNLLRAIAAIAEPELRPRLVYASTTLIYGSQHIGPVDENAVPAPESPYADTKVAAEQLIEAHALTGAMAAAILRVFNVGGAVDDVGDTDPTRIIPNLLRAASHETPSFTLVGTGTSLRDFVHVADVATAIRVTLDLVRLGDCPIYNIGSGVGTRMLDLLACVQEVTGRAIAVTHTPQEGPPARLIADITHATTHLPWTPRRSDIHTIVTDAWKCWPSK